MIEHNKNYCIECGTNVYWGFKRCWKCSYIFDEEEEYKRFKKYMDRYKEENK